MHNSDMELTRSTTKSGNQWLRTAFLRTRRQRELVISTSPVFESLYIDPSQRRMKRFRAKISRKMQTN